MHEFIDNLLEKIKDFGAIIAYIFLLTQFLYNDLLLGIALIIIPSLLAYLDMTPRSKT